jgi:uncharacterized membrane protein
MPSTPEPAAESDGPDRGARAAGAARAAGDRRTVLSTRRLESYTDGVFAIAATLLVLNLSIDGFGSARSDHEFVERAAAIAPSILNVVISFLLLGLLWQIHVRQFEFIPRVDTTLIWLNNFRLLAVVLVPFTTSLNDEFSRFLLGRTLLPLNFLVILFFSAWQWYHASSPRHALVQGVSAAAVHNGRVNSASALGQALIVVLVASVAGSAAFFVFALDPLIARVLRRVGVLRPTPDGVAVD